MKTIKLFIISVLLLSSFQALAALITERMNAVENKDQVFRLHSIKTISYAESSDREQFIISKTGITLKKQNYEALDNKTLYIKVDIVLTDGVPLRLYVIFTVLDVAEAPKNIQLSNSTIEAGSVNGTVIGTATAADDDTNNADLSYSLDDDTSNEYFSITSKGELSIKTKVNKKPGGNYLVKINASDPQNNSASKMFEITVTKAIPKFAITTADVSTLEKVAKVIDLTANKDNVSFVIGGGTDRDKFSLPKGSNKLTFAATDFKAGGDNTYSVVIIASKTGEDHISKTITVTVLDGRLHITTADAFFTPENVDKVITLTANKTVAAFTILGGDEDKFSINGTKLTFKATDFKARKNATYRVSIIATRVIMVNGHRVPETAVKELTVTVLKGVSFQITTADAFSTPENNPNMVISLTTNKDANKNVDVNFSITGGADQGKFTLSGNTLTFEATDFEARTDHTYSVETTASRRIGTENEVVTKTITVTSPSLSPIGYWLSSIKVELLIIVHEEKKHWIPS